LWKGGRNRVELDLSGRRGGRRSVDGSAAGTIAASPSRGVRHPARAVFLAGTMSGARPASATDVNCEGMVSNTTLSGHL
jgi:hypothetical protein